MAKFQMAALKAHIYAGRRLKPGDRYEIEGASDYTLMKALGHSDDAPPLESAPPKPQAAQTVRAAAKTTAKKALAGETPVRSSYFTRRLHAEAPAETAAEAAPVAGLTTSEPDA